MKDEQGLLLAGGDVAWVMIRWIDAHDDVVIGGSEIPGMADASVQHTSSILACQRRNMGICHAQPVAISHDEDSSKIYTLSCPSDACSVTWRWLPAIGCASGTCALHTWLLCRR